MWGPVGSARPIALSRSASAPSRIGNKVLLQEQRPAACGHPGPGLPGAQEDVVGSTGWADPTQQLF